MVTRWSPESAKLFSSLLKVNQVFVVSKSYFEIKTGHYKIELRNKNGESFNKLLKKCLNRK